MFDPIRAAILHRQNGDLDEAMWITFLAVHFGKNVHGGWRYAREVYGRLGQGDWWDWARASANPDQLRTWLDDNKPFLSRPGAGFSNHRKYESLDGWSTNGTGAILESYIAWVESNGGHKQLITSAQNTNKAMLVWHLTPYISQ